MELPAEPATITGGQWTAPSRSRAFATLLHLVWLMERGADNVVAEHVAAFPNFTDYDAAIRPKLIAASHGSDYPAARALGLDAPW